MDVDLKITFDVLDWEGKVVKQTIRGNTKINSVDHEMIFKALNANGSLDSLPDITRELLRLSNPEHVSLARDWEHCIDNLFKWEGTVETENLCGGTVKFSALFSSHEIKFNWEII